LKSRRLDAASFSRGAAAGLMLDPGIRPGLELVSPFIGTVLPDGTEKRGYAAFAMRPEDKELQAAFDAGLARLEADGSLLTVLKRYGFDSNDLPGDAKAETLCKG
jgi:polar amino acid transport system substrate-binding protein